MSAAGTPFSGSRRDLDVDVGPDRASEVAAALRDLQQRFPHHPDLVPLVGGGVEGNRAFLTVAPVMGESLAHALTVYGPADIADAMPRLQRVAEALDVAAAHRLWHGALTPRHVLIAGDNTLVEGVGVAETLARVGLTVPPVAPYAAPELVAGGPISAAVDQFALAAIAFEWLFGRAITGPADGPVDVPVLRNADREALAEVFATALAPLPADRFDSCSRFVRALALTADVARGREVQGPKFWVSAIRGFERLDPSPSDDMPLYPSENAETKSSGVDPSASRTDIAPSTSRHLNAATIVGLLLGAAAMGFVVVWLSTRYSAQREQRSSAGGRPFTEAAVTETPPVPPAPQMPAADARANAEPQPARPTPTAPPMSDAVRAVQTDAGLLVHSTPAGAAVAIDGVERGVTPIAVRNLPYGTRTVVVTRPGYRPTLRQVTLTAERPSRTLEVTLDATAAGAVQTTGVRAAVLVVDSRPAGAMVSIDGRPAGQTPLTIAGVSPGPHTIRIERAGYRPVITSVDVRAGQRERVAARLEGGQEEE